MKKKKTMLIVGLAVAMMLGCTACGKETAETSSGSGETAVESTVAKSDVAESASSETAEEASAWTAEGNFIDDDEYHLILYHMTEEGGYEKEGWSATVIQPDGDFFGGEMEEKNGALEGELVSLNDEGEVSEGVAATLTQDGEELFLVLEDGREFHFLPDETEYSDAESAAEMLPLFQYNQIYGDERWDPIEAAVYDYMAYEKVEKQDANNVVLPVVVNIVEVDETNPEDVLIYGDYWIFEMEKQDDTLALASGGHYPAVIHAELSESGIYTATSMEDALTDDQTKELFGEYYDKYLESGSDDTAGNEKIAQVIADYVKANNLDVTKYSLGGEEPQELPLS